MSAQVNFRQADKSADGRRSRKKEQTRSSIEESALTLFAEHGFEATTVEQISDYADVSTATFFRYFPNKADVVLCQQDGHLDELKQAILDRPADECDVDAVRAAIHRIWVPAIDPVRTMRAAKAISTSPLLRGLYGDINRTWQIGVAETLARRRGAKGVDDLSKAAARIALTVFGGAVEAWISGACCEDLSVVVDREFATFRKL